MNSDLAQVVHSARVVNMVLDSIHKRNPSPIDEGPKSDCCIAPLQRVGDELFTCSACGHLCSDGGGDY